MTTSPSTATAGFRRTCEGLKQTAEETADVDETQFQTDL